MLECEITASVPWGRQVQASANHSVTAFYANRDREEVLPNPAELLLTSLAACMLKNVQQSSKMLNIPYRTAKATAHGTRNDNPPFMSEINCKLEIHMQMNGRLLHCIKIF